MKDREKAEAMATERVQLIAPLLDEALDAARSRTLRRYVAASGLGVGTPRLQQTGTRRRTPPNHDTAPAFRRHPRRNRNRTCLVCNTQPPRRLMGQRGVG